MVQKASETQLFLGMPAVICSEPMRELMRLVQRAAVSSATVLITGETGSGKELIARAIHQYSLRVAKPWVDVNCATLPEHLIESELFGYEKGAFSGADATKQGLFELAHTGTLFLDEIGELERKMQVKLLRVLDGTPYYRVGGLRKISVDVRILTATNQDLQEATRTGAFRRDLYHRLNQVHIRVPPLRERVEDIVPLAEFFLQQQDARLRLSPEAEELLRRYSWPGNVRELRNTINKAALFAEGWEIRAGNLSLEEQDSAPVLDKISVCSLEDMERRLIVEVLSQTGGHRQKAAGVLGISRRTLNRKLKTYEIREHLPTPPVSSPAHGSSPRQDRSSDHAIS